METKKHFKGQFRPYCSVAAAEGRLVSVHAPHLSISVKDLQLGGDNSGLSELVL